jgi:hypothetical protein
LYAAKLSTRVAAQEIDETGNEEVSTAAVKVTKNFSQQKLTIGLDLGDQSSWYCLQ